MSATPLAAPRYWYLAGLGSWFVPQGVLSVLVPWLVGEYLQLDGARYFGVAYAVFTVPTVAFVLLGGLAADRVDPRRILVCWQGGLGLLAALVAAFAFGGRLGYPLLLLYLFAVGSASAFVRPARDALLSPVAGAASGPPVRRLVAAATAVQFGVQILGFALAAAVDRLGTGVMFTLMALVLLGGALTATRLPAPAGGPHQARPHPAGGPAARADALAGVLREPLQALRAVPGLTPLMLINLVVGICYTGAYFVVVPSVILALPRTGAGALSAASVAFMTGTLVATALLLRSGGLAGRHLSGMMLALAVNGLALCVICLAAGMGAVLAGMFVWGSGTSVAIALGRTLVQERSPAPLRARLLALYMLTFLCGTPLGSLLLGFLSGPVGARAAGIAAAAVTLLCLAGIALVADVRGADRWQAGRGRRALPPPGPGAGAPAARACAIEERFVNLRIEASSLAAGAVAPAAPAAAAPTRLPGAGR